MTRANQVQNSRGQPLTDEMISKLLLDGDISSLSEYERVQYYKAVCERVGLDPSTQPFSILHLKKKVAGKYEPRTILYLNASGGQQLNRKHKVSHEMRDEKLSKNIYRIFYRASTPDGRFTDSAGVVSIAGLTGDDLSNAVMRAETKAKRRSTIDLLGLSAFDGSGGPVTVPENDPSPVNNQEPDEPEKYKNSEQSDSSDPGDHKFQFGWNKDKTIREVYDSKGEKEIRRAMEWCQQNNKFPDFIASATEFFESISGEPKKAEKPNEPVSQTEENDLPF